MHDADSAGGGPVCYWHHSSPAVARCLSCGRNICADCAVQIDGRNYCRYCSASYQPQQYPSYLPQQYPPYQPHYQPPRQEKKWYSFLQLKGPPPFPGANWHWWEPIIIYFAAFVISMVAATLLYMVFGSDTSLESFVFLTLILSVAQYGALTAGIYISVKVVHKRSFHDIGLKSKGIGGSLALGVGFGLPLFIGAIVLSGISSYVLRSIFNLSETDTLSKSFAEASKGGVNPWLVFVLVFIVVVLAPVFEEMFFRGYLYPALRNHMGMQPAMLLDGFLFSLVHLNIFGFLPIMLLGYGLCYVFEKQKNLAGPMLGHAIYNGIIAAIWLIFL